MNGLIYLASPYSHPDPQVRTMRFDMACRAAAHLMVRGMLVFSPIAHTHPIAMVGALPLGWDYWQLYDSVMLGCCAELLILTLSGWQESAGVIGELAIAHKDLGLPVRYMAPHSWEITEAPQ
jgi:hypothetical protein